jgi:hypothetical protein
MSSIIMVFLLQGMCTRLPANSPQYGSDAGDNNNSWLIPEQIPRETLAARRPCGPQLVAPGSGDVRRPMFVAGLSGLSERNFPIIF